MSKAELILAALTSATIGAAVPIASLYYMSKGLSPVVGFVTIFLSLGVALALGAIGFGTGYHDQLNVGDLERIRLLRAGLRSVAEDLDSSVELLREIRDLLSVGDQSERRPHLGRHK
ncbi:MAG: hypothetical protein ACP5T5_03325 [Thermoprotei archaeon]